MPPERVLAHQVEQDSWAELQGVQEGDELIQVDGTPLQHLSAKDLKQAMRKRPLSLMFARHGPEPNTALSDAQKPAGKQQGHGQKYEVVAEQVVKSLGFIPSAMPPERVFVATVTPDTWASQQGVQEGHQLVGVEGRPVSELTKDELKRLMKQRPLRLKFKGLAYGSTLAEELPAEHAVPTLARKRASKMGAKIDLVAEDGDDLGFAPSGFPPERIFVVGIEDAGWADMHGLEVGDELLTLNGQGVTTMTRGSFQQAVCVRPLQLTFANSRMADDMPATGPSVADVEGAAPAAGHSPLTSGPPALPVMTAGPPKLPGLPGAPAGDTKTKVVDYVNEGDKKLGFKPSGTDPESTILVETVEPGGLAENQGVKAGDRLMEANNKAVDTLDKKELKAMLRDRPLRLKFGREKRRK